MPKAVIYTRVSDKGYSHDYQSQTIRDYCAGAWKLDVAKEFAERSVVSLPKSLPVLQSALDYAEEHLTSGDYFCCWNLSRLGRVIDALAILDLLREKSINFRSAHLIYGIEGSQFMQAL
jgi:DNA invertase Pin-like site-specific DNA recombinase